MTAVFCGWRCAVSWNSWPRLIGSDSVQSNPIVVCYIGISRATMSPKSKAVLAMVFTVGGGLMAIVMVSGIVYEQVQRAKDREQFPQIGRSVDIGGRTLNLYCSGTGSPAVILESGATWPFFD